MKNYLGNKGYSLVELIVVVAIMAIGLTLLTISVSTVFSNNVRSAATDIDAFISRGVINSNYRNPLVFIELTRDASDNLVVRYYENYPAATDFAEEKIVGGANIGVTLNGFGTLTTVTSADPLRLAFNRSTAEILLITDLSASPISTEKFPVTGGGGVINPTITLGNTGASRYVITLTPHTGGHEVTK